MRAPVDDMIEVISDILGPSVDVFSMQDFLAKEKSQGVLVEQRGGAVVPDIPSHTDTLHFDITIKGAGAGGTDNGRARDYARRVAEQIYRGCFLILDRDVGNGDEITSYIRISVDSPPQEAVSGAGTFIFRLGLEAVRFIEGLKW